MAEKSPDTLMMEGEGLEAVQRAVERLPEAYRDVITLLSEGKLPQEIAEILGCSPNAATIRCCRARKALRDLLEGNMQESGRH
jgi:DNA-directed RNA polymerase specialized sigma24 family protein